MPKNDISCVADIVALYLADGPKPYDEVKAHCAKLGISKAELRAARVELKVRTINTGKTWLWYVPDPESDDNARINTGTTFGSGGRADRRAGAEMGKSG